MRHGIFLLLLMHCWDQKGPLPLDEQECAGIANCRSADEVEGLRYVIGKFFVRMVDGHYNRRMQLEVEKSEALSNVRSEAGRKGYEAKAKHLSSKSQASASIPIPIPTLSPASPPTPSPEKPSGEVRAKRSPAPSAEVWASYSQAYLARYTVEPVRNKKVNAQLAQVVERLVAAEAPGVAAFYLSHRNQLYVNAKHCVDLMLRDCERLRTEWVTGKQGTHAQAVLTDRTQTNANVFGAMIEEARRNQPVGGA
jgi:hypothetical protein